MKFASPQAIKTYENQREGKHHSSSLQASRRKKTTRCHITFAGGQRAALCFSK
jgi:hypothetical protein